MFLFGSYDIEYQITRPDGAVRVIHALGETFTDSDGRVVRMVGTVIDITESKR